MVYLDNAASTPPLRSVVEAQVQAAETLFANPSSAHSLGAAAARALATARAQVNALLGRPAGQIFFTSGGTEANAMAVLGAARARKQKHVVMTAIEHPSVLANVQRLEQEGFAISLVPPAPDGVVDADRLLQHITAQTGLVAMMLINSEVGTQQPVERVGQALAQLPRPPHFHVDAVQAAPFLPLRPNGLFASSLSLSGHKLHGPKGTGALWLREGMRLVPLWAGGGQEGAMRSGTENLPGAVGLGQACEACAMDQTRSAADVAALRDRFEQDVLAALPCVQHTLPPGTPRAPHISSLRFANLPAEPLLHALQERGVFAAAGSACASKKTEQSHVLAAMGVPERDAVLRFSFSRLTAGVQVEQACTALVEAVDEIGTVTSILSGGRRR